MLDRRRLYRAAVQFDPRGIASVFAVQSMQISLKIANHDKIR